MKKLLVRKLAVISMITISLTTLTGCSSDIDDLFSFSPMPKKVTIEKAEEASSATSSADSSSSSAGGASAAETPEAAPTDAPIEHAPLNSVGIDESSENTGLTAQKRKEVIEQANYRLDHGFYSRSSLINGLVSDGFTYEEAEYGADHCYIEWE